MLQCEQKFTFILNTSCAFSALNFRLGLSGVLFKTKRHFRSPISRFEGGGDGGFQHKRRRKSHPTPHLLCRTRRDSSSHNLWSVRLVRSQKFLQLYQTLRGRVIFSLLLSVVLARRPVFCLGFLSVGLRVRPRTPEGIDAETWRERKCFAYLVETLSKIKTGSR